MANQSKTPLKVVVAGSIFSQKTHFISENKTALVWTLKSHIRNFSSVGGAGLPPPPPPPLMGVMSSISKCIKSKAKINFIHVLTIKEDIFGSFGTLHLWTELYGPNRAVKMVEKRCKSAQMSTKCWSIVLKFGQKILCNLLNLTAQVLELHLV